MEDNVTIFRLKLVRAGNILYVLSSHPDNKMYCYCTVKMYLFIIIVMYCFSQNHVVNQEKLEKQELDNRWPLKNKKYISGLC